MECNNGTGRKAMVEILASERFSSAQPHAQEAHILSLNSIGISLSGPLLRTKLVISDDGTHSLGEQRCYTDFPRKERPTALFLQI